MKKIKIIPLLFCVLMAGFGQNLQAQNVKPGLNHIALYVVDLKKSTDFYKDFIGLDTIPEPFHDGRHTWFAIGPKSHLHVIQGAKAVTPHDMNSHLCFAVPDVQVYVDKLQKANMNYVNAGGEAKKVTLRVDGVKQVYFQDPDGYWIEINDAKQ
jgi:lactoylglutathione lyase